MPVKVESTTALPSFSPVGGHTIVARLDGACMSYVSGNVFIAPSWPEPRSKAELRDNALQCAPDYRSRLRRLCTESSW